MEEKTDLLFEIILLCSDVLVYCNLSLHVLPKAAASGILLFSKMFALTLSLCGQSLCERVLPQESMMDSEQQSGNVGKGAFKKCKCLYLVQPRGI